MSAQPNYLGGMDSQAKIFTAGHSTRISQIWTPGANGSRVNRIWACTSLASSTLQIALYLLKTITLQSAMGTGAMVDGGAGSDTITRSAGDFAADGWVIGDRLLVVKPTTLANEFIATLTAVASGTLTFATGTVNTAENLPSGSALCRAMFIGQAQVMTGGGAAIFGPPVECIERIFTGAKSLPQTALELPYVIVPTNSYLGAAWTTAASSTTFHQTIVEGGNY